MDFSSTIPDYIIRALSNTFLYSLWQGVILAAGAGLVILLTRRSAPAKRYNLLVGLMITFALTIISTFVIHYYKAAVISKQATANALHSETAGIAVQLSETTKDGKGSFSFLDYINTHAEMIVMIWFLIVCARCVQLLTGLHGLQRMRREAGSPGMDWEERLRSLAQSMGITQQVIMAESAIAKVPMVIGHLKPIILVPAALLTAMQPAEIEAVLIHELAHIRRRDYLVNMLQHLMEIVFFFNPAVLWVSSLIKTERENCCDDITLGKTNDKTAYIRALICCQEFQSQTPVMAVGLSGRKNLLGRVNRMVSHSNHSLSIFEKSLLAVCLVMAGIMLVAFANRPERNGATAAPPVVQRVPGPTVVALSRDSRELNTFRIYKPDEVGEGTSVYIGNVGEKKGFKTYILKQNGKLYQLNYITDTLVSLQINGTSVEPEIWPAYTDEIQELAQRKGQKLDGTFNFGDSRTSSAGSGIFERAEKTLAAGVERTKNVIDAVGMDLGSTIRKMQAAEDALKSIKNNFDGPGESRQPDRGLSQRDFEKPPSKITPVKTVEAQYKPLRNEYTEYKTAITERNRYRDNYIPGSRPMSRRENWITVEELINYLVAEGLVSKPEDVRSFMLNPQQMIMNNKLVPASVHQMILDKYVKADKKEKWTMYYNFDTSTIKSITRDGINAS